ncbi:helix-turn-helix domain-containing protein [Deinococcus sp. UYEF24]
MLIDVATRPLGMSMAYDASTADPRVLGERLRSYIRASGKTQAKVAEEIGTDPTYVSQLVNGRVNWVKSDYFRRLTAVLGLSVAEIADLNPDLIVSEAEPSEKRYKYSAGARGWKVPKQEPEPIPDSLLEAAALYGDNEEFSGIREYRWQRWMADSPHKKRPSTPEEWLGFYMTVKDRFNPKEPEE